MSVFIERFLLYLCAAAFLGFVINNGMSLDIHQRVGLGVALVGLAYFFGHTAYKKTHTTPPALVQPAVTVPAETLKKSGDAETSGSNSPAVTGDGNVIKYDQSVRPKNKSNPPNKSRTPK